jgi:PDZ domain-containing protein
MIRLQGMIAETELETAHLHSSRHRGEILESAACGCFYCRRIFPPEEIADWVDEEGGIGQTALCPYCGIDSVIGSASGDPITKEFLTAMRRRWFGSRLRRRIFIFAGAGVAIVGVALAWFFGERGIRPRVLGGPVRIVQVDEALLKRGFLGIDYGSAAADQLESSSFDGGVVVMRVVSGSPADIAGVNVGDVLVMANGVRIGDRAALQALSARWMPGDEVTLTVIRGDSDDQSEQVMTARLASFAEMQEVFSREP